MAGVEVQYRSVGARNVALSRRLNRGGGFSFANRFLAQARKLRKEPVKRLKGFDGFEIVKRGIKWHPPAEPWRFWSRAAERWFAMPLPDTFPTHSFWVHDKEQR